MRTSKPKWMEMYKDAVYIYTITCLVNNRKYVGRTMQPRFRVRAHYNALISNRHNNKRLQEDFNKYGVENFMFQIIERNPGSCHASDTREAYWMKKYKSYLPEFGYNEHDPRFEPTRWRQQEAIRWHG